MLWNARIAWADPCCIFRKWCFFIPSRACCHNEIRFVIALRKHWKIKEVPRAAIISLCLRSSVGVADTPPQHSRMLACEGNVQRASIISLFRAPSARSCIASSVDIFNLEPSPPFHRHFSAKGQTPQYARSRSYSQALKYSSFFACKKNLHQVQGRVDQLVDQLRFQKV